MRSWASVAGEDVLGRRVAAALIDLAILFVVLIVVGVLTGGVAGDEVLLDTTGMAVFAALAALYHLALESTLGRTVGKLLLGLRVVGWDGGRPSGVAVAIRTILRIVDWLPALYVVGFVAMIATGARRQRLGDLAAETHVERTAPVRHRGLAAALLAFVLVAALALSTIPLLVLGEYASTSSSSVCVGDRCNATARGGQVLELAGRDVEVSAIGAGRATFTIDGHTVALRVEETRRVGGGLVHLAVVEGDVARFTVDFSGLFLNRDDLTRESGDAPAAPAPSMQVSDDQEVISVDVPAAWSEVDGSENAEYGPSVWAAPDLDGFRRTWDTPGIMVEVSSRLGPQDVGAIMRQLGPADDCTSEGREAHEDRRHTGAVERWSGCGGTGTVVVTAALAPPDGSFLLRVYGQAIDDRDLVALDRALATIQVGSLSEAPSAGVATADAWLRRIGAVRVEIDDAIAATDSELTPAVLDQMATAMRACSGELTAAAPTSTGLRPVRALVDDACAEYDKGAECLATAADIREPIVAGSADDRRFTRAIDCGFDALNRGAELLAEAEIRADMQSRPG